jgi:hypothetical protein
MKGFFFLEAQAAEDIFEAAIDGIKATSKTVNAFIKEQIRELEKQVADAERLVEKLADAQKSLTQRKEEKLFDISLEGQGPKKQIIQIENEINRLRHEALQAALAHDDERFEEIRARILELAELQRQTEADITSAHIDAIEEIRDKILDIQEKIAKARSDIAGTDRDIDVKHQDPRASASAEYRRRERQVQKLKELEQELIDLRREAAKLGPITGTPEQMREEAATLQRIRDMARIKELLVEEEAQRALLLGQAQRELDAAQQLLDVREKSFEELKNLQQQIQDFDVAKIAEDAITAEQERIELQKQLTAEIERYKQLGEDSVNIWLRLREIEIIPADMRTDEQREELERLKTQLDGVREKITSIRDVWTDVTEKLKELELEPAAADVINQAIQAQIDAIDQAVALQRQLGVADEKANVLRQQQRDLAEHSAKIVADLQLKAALTAVQAQKDGLTAARVASEEILTGAQTRATDLQKLVDNINILLEESSDLWKGLSGGEGSGLQSPLNEIVQVGSRSVEAVKELRDALEALRLNENITTLERTHSALLAVIAQFEFGARNKQGEVQLQAMEAIKTLLLEVGNALKQESDPGRSAFIQETQDIIHTITLALTENANKFKEAIEREAEILGTTQSTEMELIAGMDRFVVGLDKSLVTLENVLTRQQEQFNRPAFDITQRAHGGLIGSHPGGPRGTDTVPVWASPGEYIVNAASTKKFYSQLKSINSGIQPLYQESGGMVTDVGGINVTVNESKNPQKTAKIVAAEINRGIRQGTIKLRSS